MDPAYPTLGKSCRCGTLIALVLLQSARAQDLAIFLADSGAIFRCNNNYAPIWCLHLGERYALSRSANSFSRISNDVFNSAHAGIF